MSNGYWNSNLNFVAQNSTFNSVSVNNITVGNIYYTGSLIQNGTSSNTSNSTANFISTNLTTTNLLSTNSSFTNLFSNFTSLGNLTSNTGTFINLFASFTSLGNLTSSTGTFANKVGGSQTVGTLVITTSASLIGNTNTIGSIYTTGGNVGINTTSPNFTLDILGTLRITNSLTTGTLNSTNLLSTNNTLTNLIYTNATGTSLNLIGLSATNLTITNLTTSNLISTNITTSSLNALNIQVSGNMTIGGNLLVAGSLTTVNITSINVIDNNITAGSLNSTFATINNLNTVTATIPNVIHTNITTTSILSSGPSNLFFNTNTIGNLFTTGGNVGIGTNSPAFTLDVNGIIRSNIPIPTVGNNDAIYIGQSLSNNNSAIIDYNYTTVGSSSNSIGLGFFGANNKLVVQAGGNVGINTTSPQFTLDVAGSLRSVALNSAQFSPPHTLINTGTLNPSVVSLLAPNVTVGNNVSTMFGQSLSNGNCGQLNFQYYGSNNSANNMSLSMYGPGAAAYISLNNNGNVGINTTTPLYPLHVVGSSIGFVTGGYYFYANSGTALIQWSTSNQPIGIFATSAILTQNNFLASSDLRIKNICNEEINLNLIDRINPVIYTYKDKIKNPKKNIGFIAQNVFEHCPEAVTLHKGIIPDIMKLVDIIENKDTIITIKNEWLLKEKDIIKIMVDDKDTAGELIDIIYADKDVIKFKHVKLKQNVFIYGRQVEDFHELNYDYIFALGFAGIQKSRKEIKELKQDNILLKQDIKELKQDNILSKRIKEQQQQINHQQKQINSLVELIKNKK